MILTSGIGIATKACFTCPICGSEGLPYYDDVRDPWHASAESWSLRRCPDARCGHLWLDPMPTDDCLAELYGEDYYTKQERDLPPRLQPLQAVMEEALDTYVSASLGYRLARHISRRRSIALRVLLRILPGARDWARDSACHLSAPPPAGRLLEVGFGDAHKMERMAALGWQVTGIDLDEDVVRKARARGLDVHQGDLSAHAFPAGSFDGIYVSHLLEHVPDPVQFLHQCHRLLKPGGTLVILTPNTGSLSHRHFGATWFPLMPPQHLGLFSRTSIELAAHRAGFGGASARSSARYGLATWLGCAWVAHGGTIDPSASTNGRRVPVSSLARAFAGTIAESCLEAIGRPAGEELVMLATRTG